MLDELYKSNTLKFCLESKLVLENHVQNLNQNLVQLSSSYFIQNLLKPVQTNPLNLLRVLIFQQILDKLDPGHLLINVIVWKQPYLLQSSHYFAKSSESQSSSKNLLSVLQPVQLLVHARVPVGVAFQAKGQVHILLLRAVHQIFIWDLFNRALIDKFAVVIQGLQGGNGAPREFISDGIVTKLRRWQASTPGLVFCDSFSKKSEFTFHFSGWLRRWSSSWPNGRFLKIKPLN